MKDHVKLFKSKLEKARNLSLKVEIAQSEVFNYLESIGIDVEKSIDEYNLYTIEEIITTYVSYGDRERMEDFIKLLEELK